MEQNLPPALIGGGIAALVGAGIWAVVTVATGYQIGWMAIGVGFLVGITVRFLGKGIDPVFGIVGAAWALVGCVVGNMLAICGVMASEMDMAFTDVLTMMSPELMVALMGEWFSVMDLLFYGLALYEGYKLSFRQLEVGELSKEGAAV